MSFLADSDVLIDAMRGQQDARDSLAGVAPDGLSISIISLGELYDGAYATTRAEEHVQRLHQFLAGYMVLGLSNDTVHVFGQVRATLRKQGNLIADLDLLIASTAITHDLTLITRNVRHFARIDGLRLYSGVAD